MASRGGYDGGSGAGGKIRRRPPSRAATASPYARPAPAPSAAAPSQGGDGGGWLTRFIAGGASRLLSSVFRKPLQQLAAPPQPERFDALPSRPELVDASPSHSEQLDAPPSPPPPPLEDDISEGEENGGVIANNLSTDNPDSSAKEGDGHGSIDLEELLKQRTFTRSEFEYLVELLRSRTVGSNSLKPEVSNIKQMHCSEKENGSRDLPADFSIRTYNVVDHVASPAEHAKAYMGSRSSKGSPLRLRLHDPSSLPVKSTEANTIQIAKPPTLCLLPSSRLHGSTPSDHPGSNYMNPNRSAIYKMSSSPYFKKAISSRDLSGTVSSSYQTASSVHTFGRQVLKRKSSALNNETVSVGPIRKMRQRYNKVSPLLEIRPGYRGYLGSRASKLDEDFEDSTQTQKRRCLGEIGDGTRGDVDNRAHDDSFGRVPAQSTEMAAKILKQLDTLVPSQKEGTSGTRQKHGNAMDAEDPISQKKEVFAQSDLLGPFSSGVKEYSAAKITPAAIDCKTVDATSNRSAVLKRKSASEIISPKDSLEVDDCSGNMKIDLHQANDKIEGKKSMILEHTAKNSGSTNKEKPPTFSLRSHPPSNLVLSSEIDRNKMLASSNGFSFPVPAALGVHSQAPPTPTMSSPPLLPVEKLHSSAVSSAPVTYAETVPRILKPVSEEGTISNKCASKLNAETPQISSKSSGKVVSFTSNPVFSVVSSKPATLSNGLAHTASSTASFPHFSFRSGFQTSAQQSGGTQVKAEPVITAPFSTQSSSTGGSFSFSNTATGSSSASSTILAATTQAVTTPSLASSGAGRGGAPFSFSPQFGSASSLAAQDKSKGGGSSTSCSLSPQFCTARSFTAQDRSKASSPESTLLSGNQCAQSGNNSSLFSQSSASNSNVISSEKSNSGSSLSFANSSFGSAPSGSSPINSSSMLPFLTGSGSTSVTITTTPSSPAAASAFGSGTAFLASPIFGSNLTTTAPPSFGLLNTAAASPFSSTSSPVFSFTSATPTVPNPSPTTPIFGRTSPAVGLSTGTDLMNGGHMIELKNQSPTSTAPPFGLPSSSPSTPVFSTPATQLASTTSASPGIFQFGQQNQASSGGFSLGTGGGNDNPGRRIVKVKRKK